MLRQLGSTNERGDPSLRKADVDPFDSIFVVEIFGRGPTQAADDEASMPVIHSIWCNLSEARVAAERALTQDWPFTALRSRVMEYQTNVFRPHMERHGSDYQLPVVVSTEVEKMAQLTLEINRLRAQLGQMEIAGAASGVV